MARYAGLTLSKLQDSDPSTSGETLAPIWRLRSQSVSARLLSEADRSVVELDCGPEGLLKLAVGEESLQVFKCGPAHLLLLVAPGTKAAETYSLRFGADPLCDEFHAALQELREQSGAGGTEVTGGGSRSSVFDQKIEAASAKMYFHYYGQLLHQQNMLQDYVRTGTYYAAVLENRSDFEGRVVVDVGAGSGILSLFAAQAGAKHVYAIEASPMAEYAKKLAAGNPGLGHLITVIHGKVEEVEVPEKADILISEPMGTLLVNERMLETYVIARQRFLKPGGKMFPSIGRIHLAPFSDEYLYGEVASKALFWQQRSYYGVDLTPLHDAAFTGYFSQPVVDAFDPRLLVAPHVTHTIDFTTSTEEELQEIDVPLAFKSTVAARVHGLACWFDVLFDGSTSQRWLSTAPGQPTTHWYQLRCVLPQPLYVLGGQEIAGRLRLAAHSSQSYTIHLSLSSVARGPAGQRGPVLQTAFAKLDLKEPYYRMSQATWVQEQQAAATQQVTPAQQMQDPQLAQLPQQYAQALLAQQLQQQQQQQQVPQERQQPQQVGHDFGPLQQSHAQAPANAFFYQ